MLLANFENVPTGLDWNIVAFLMGSSRYSSHMRLTLVPLALAFFLLGCGGVAPGAKPSPMVTETVQSNASVVLALGFPSTEGGLPNVAAFVRPPAGTVALLRDGGFAKESPALRPLLESARERFARHPGCVAANIELVGDVLVEPASGYPIHGGGYVTITKVSGWRFIDHDAFTRLIAHPQSVEYSPKVFC